MSKFLKILGWGLGGIVGFVMLVVAGIWLVSDQKFNRKFTAPDDLSAPNHDTETLAAGEHLATITGRNPDLCSRDA